MKEILNVSNAVVEYDRQGLKVRAVAGVDLTLNAGEILGLVGESGCGKSTLGKAIVGILKTAHGEIVFDGSQVKKLTRGQRPKHFRNLQMVFQDPYGSLNPRRKIGAQIADGLVVGGSSRKDALHEAQDLLEKVGLPRNAIDRFPHEFSGGQRQRISIARALAAAPTAIVADEPISALDTSSQAQVANLLVNLVEEYDMGMVFISHDLSIVRRISDRVAVMYLGKIVEIGTVDQIWNNPSHPYTRALISAIPHADGTGFMPQDLPGDVPNPMSPPSGCRFHPRCPLAMPECAEIEPAFRTLSDGRSVACHLQTEGSEPVSISIG
ncbi:MAG: ABC transporter ATP-binding protein [Actinobacteria bacterium]|nr:ABC transporter ATP-binding protein [Actinomycetota bacterium]